MRGAFRALPGPCAGWSPISDKWQNGDLFAGKQSPSGGVRAAGNRASEPALLEPGTPGEPGVRREPAAATHLACATSSTPRDGVTFTWRGGGEAAGLPGKHTWLF